MKAAKAAPSSEICGEAAALVDVHLRWIEAKREAELKGKGEVEIATSKVSQVAAMFADSDIWTKEVREMRSRVLNAAVAEYLRRFPVARSTGATYVNVIDDEDTHVVCLFCRTNLNTFGKVFSANSGFWRKIYEHTELCAYRMLAGQLEPVGPGGAAGEKSKPISKLKGAELIRAAEQAAAYLGETLPKYRAKRGTRTGLRKGLATELRALVVRARKLAAQTATRFSPFAADPDSADTNNDEGGTTC